jgi:hypothetical protein
MGILKTVEVEVVEEDITDSNRPSTGDAEDDWQNVLRGGVMMASRSGSRASARDRD